jgi:hypothetical protein
MNERIRRLKQRLEVNERLGEVRQVVASVGLTVVTGG